MLRFKKSGMTIRQAPILYMLLALVSFSYGAVAYSLSLDEYTGSKHPHQSVSETSTEVTKCPQPESDDTNIPEEATEPVENINENLAQDVIPKEPVSINNLSLNAGCLSTITLENLPSGQTSMISLTGYIFSDVAFSWNTGSFSYTFSNDPSDISLEPITLNDDIVPFSNIVTSSLIHTGTSPSYLFIKPTQDIARLQIDLINPTAQSGESSGLALSSTGVFNKDSGAKYTTLNIISRDTWGASPNTWDPYDSKNIDDPSRFTWVPVYHPVSRIVIHHTATPNNPADPAATVRAIYIYHAHTLGWGDIGYNYIIDHLGNIYEGKNGGDEVFGYHARTEANAMSIGIAIIGDYRYVYPTEAAQQALVKLMGEKATFFDFDLRYSNGSLAEWKNSAYTVFGHNGSWYWDTGSLSWNINSTACPGAKLTELLSAKTTSLAQTYKQNNFQVMKQVVAMAEDAITSEHEPDRILVMFDLPESADSSEVLAKIPSFSGISDVNVKKNRAEIIVLDWENGGYTVPPDGWDGYNNPGTFFPPPNGTDDRLKTLLKIFTLDPEVKGVSLFFERDLF